ncbi:MAG: prolyl aminopeptidase [Pseudomonadota bacterium]
MYTLYPDIKPYATQMLPVDAPHEIYVEECGNPDGIPILFVHGGPGGGCEAKNRCFFDPEHYRIVLFDQRGAGRSMPHASLEDNHTQALIDDMERIRETLGIEHWCLFGGSWGSTLSLLYAQQHTERVTGLILRGIFLVRQADLDWFYQSGADRLFPDYWQEYLHPVAEARRDSMIEAYYDLLTGDNEVARMAAAKAWSGWEGQCATLRPNSSVLERFVDPHHALALARIECHYFINSCFIEENQILNNAERLADIPTIIVHGRYDAVCTLDNAYALHKALPNSELRIITEAGHAASEPGITDALVHATQQMAQRLKPTPDPA